MLFVVSVKRCARDGGIIYLSLRKAMYAIPGRVQLHLEVPSFSSLLWICAIEEPVHAERLVKLHISLGLVRLLRVPVELNSLQG